MLFKNYSKTLELMLLIGNSKRKIRLACFEMNQMIKKVKTYRASPADLAEMIPALQMRESVKVVFP